MSTDFSLELVQRCNNLKVRIYGGTSSKDDVQLVLVSARKLLEHSGQKDSFPILNSFCDWSLHSVLNHRSKRIIFQSINGTGFSPPIDLPTYSVTGELMGFGEKVTESIFGLHAMRFELNCLLTSIKAFSCLISDDICESFYRNIADLVCGIEIDVSNRYLCSSGHLDCDKWKAETGISTMRALLKLMISRHSEQPPPPKSRFLISGEVFQSTAGPFTMRVDMTM